MGDKAWKIIERSGLFIGTVCAIITAYFTVGLFYGWNVQSQPQPKLAGALMIAPWWLWILGGIGIALLITAWAMIVIRSRQKPVAVLLPVPPQKIPTRLRLQFNGGGALPLMVDEQNVWRWYSIAQVQVFVRENQPNERRVASWQLFMVFNQPVDFRQLRIDGGGTAIPPSEVKDSGVRHAVIVFDGDMPACVLTVEAML